MAKDGSFCSKSSTERFLSCYPAAAPLFQNPISDYADDDALIGSLLQIFLHPDYTLPFLGFFRPISQKIIHHASSSSKSRNSFTNQNSNSSPYLLKKDSPDLHLATHLAFCRALDLLPSLFISIFRYFDSSPPPFYRISIPKPPSETLENFGSSLLISLRVTYRLLLLNPDSFRGIWDWSSFIQFLPNFLSAKPNFGEKTWDIRWCAVQILALVLNLGENTAIKQLGMDPVEDFGCLLRWWEFCEDSSMEKAGFYIQLPVVSSTDSSVKKSHSFLRNCEKNKTISGFDGDPFVLTTTMEKSFEMAELALSQKWPVLLYGPPGSGKTALINTMAVGAGAPVLSIHMDDQVDGKMLVGGYVCGEVPGEFKWQLGSLSMAVLRGLWVVLENIDRASSDVQSLLVPLLEGSPLFDAGNGQMVNVADGFRLFSTISCCKLEEIRGCNDGRGLFSLLWRKIAVLPPRYDDMCEIVKVWYPKMEPISGVVVHTFERIVEKKRSCSFSGRFTVRDLIKWCKRVHLLELGSMEASLLSSHVRGLICEEAVDVFAASSASPGVRSDVAEEIYRSWENFGSPYRPRFFKNKPQVEESISELIVGRVRLARVEVDGLLCRPKRFIETSGSLCLLERVACSVKCNEAVLLVGETGTGKTTLVQNLAEKLGQRLTVLNLSQQSDVSDLLGGFKPTDASFVCVPLYNEFAELFSKTFSAKTNEEFLGYVQKQVRAKKWRTVLKALQKGLNTYRTTAGSSGHSDHGGKRKRRPERVAGKSWEDFQVKLDKVKARVLAPSGVVFSFVEGAFVGALRRGEWVLLDEVNLAPPETLQRVVGVLEGEKGSLCLAERGDSEYIFRHPNFRLFACMNPATDTGKHDLPLLLRSRFTEYFVDDLEEEGEIAAFIHCFVDRSMVGEEMIGRMVGFYKAAKRRSEEELQDGANQKPQYSLRSLYRALEYVKKARKKMGLQRAIYDGFSMFFLTMLDGPGARVMHGMIVAHLLGGKEPKSMSFDGYLTARAESVPALVEAYVLTASVRGHLVNLGRAVFMKRYPVLLQGPTSSGKTSLVQYMAAVTGHEFVRINNHEHTDLQEYLGSYIADAQGRLVFQEGVLVRAVRAGHWVVLDELNLAPSDVLEALNRLLDDNRELFVPELCETVRAHPDFMLFATQNPPSLYGGRKTLSRAFRNRFVEIHVDQIPDGELSTILEKRCVVPASYAGKMVEVMKELQSRRQHSRVFAGKDGFITPRDLFRWADRFNRFGCTYADLALDGYLLLAERLRDDSEKSVVQEVIEKHLRVTLKTGGLYRPGAGHRAPGPAIEPGTLPGRLGDVVWTDSMWRVYYLVERCYRMREPVLLVGETGGGKTTVCQLLSTILGSKLHILNCHQFTETADFLGGFYPLRERANLADEFRSLVIQLEKDILALFPGDVALSPDIERAPSTLRKLSEITECQRQIETDISIFERLKMKMEELNSKWQTIFSWQDGPLVRAMREGDILLLDEISLADDSVLERLNSVLEPERKLSLAEMGGSEMENVVAHPDFFLIATMNPGGDFGKKELSPALRNRFTEIWVPSVTDPDELRAIAGPRMSFPEPFRVLDPILTFWDWFNRTQTSRPLTVRDLLSWVEFVEVVRKTMSPEQACLHGAFLVLLDGLGLGTGMSKPEMLCIQKKSLSVLLHELSRFNGTAPEQFPDLDMFGHDPPQCGDCGKSGVFGIEPFFIERGSGEKSKTRGFEFSAPTTRRNALRVLRAMQLRKPILLEGSPGVGKTSLVTAIGGSSGHRVVRINMSEHTELTDLLGSDLPEESDEGVRFSWSDGILLQALKDGSWVLLDELNLAPQSVLEGLNAILDHRAEVFIPEIHRVFKCPPSFRVFACQNPSRDGSGRKGLPRSFLNRFSKVYVEELVEEDYLHICSTLFPSLEEPLLSNLVAFNKQLYIETTVLKKFAIHGSPWEFNLRDIIRSCEIIKDAPEKTRASCFLNTVYLQRMRTPGDREEVLRIYQQVFGVRPYVEIFPRVRLTPGHLFVGESVTRRTGWVSDASVKSQLKILPQFHHCLEAVSQCLRHNWLCILVGPPASGKTSLIRLTAHLTGNVLNEINLSPGTDISEMLGCFEQFERLRKFSAIVARIESHVKEILRSRLEQGPGDFLKQGVDKFMGKWLSFLSGFHSPSSVSSPGSDFQKITQRSVILLAEIIEQLQVEVEKNTIINVKWSRSGLEKMRRTVLKLKDEGENKPVKFEWVAGSLIKAIEKGEWVVLENASLCNPTVLDRINSLVEPCGSITVNECGLVDGEPLILRPHEDFRMFLTVNPNHGNVSRAMRNRGVEIFLMPPYWPIGEGESAREEAEIRDVKRFLVLSGIPFPGIVDLMAKAHVFADREASGITILELQHWAQLFQKLLENGNRPLWSLHRSWEHAYLSSLGGGQGSDIIDRVKAFLPSEPEHLSARELSRGPPLVQPLKLKDHLLHSYASSVFQNCMYLNSLTRIEQNREIPLEIGKIGFSLTGSSSSSLPHHLIIPKLLFFGANWVVEQATEIDLGLYLSWFRWAGAKNDPFSRFLTSFGTLLEEERKHPLWKYIFDIRRELSHRIDPQSHPVPLLSSSIFDYLSPCETTGSSSSSHKHLSNAIECVGRLRLTLHQWNVETGRKLDGRREVFGSIFRLLRVLEEQILSTVTESVSFSLLIRLYDQLLQGHLQLWEALLSDQFEHLLVSWRSLMKTVAKLNVFYPGAVGDLFTAVEDLDLPFRGPGIEKSLLWIHGGHPFLPPSALLYHQHQELLSLCNSIWPQPGSVFSEKKSTVEAVVSSNPHLRLLVTQGICLSLNMMEEDGRNAATSTGVLRRQEEIHLLLSERYEEEKKKTETNLASASSLLSEISCCSFDEKVLVREQEFEAWKAGLCIADHTSLVSDTNLLEIICGIVLLEEGEIFARLTSMQKPLQSSMEFSLTRSSRSPLCFLPHQKFLWVLQSWSVIDGAGEKISSFALEMWFRWHSSMWDDARLGGEEDVFPVGLPAIIHPVKANSVTWLMADTSVKEYHLRCSKLRAVSRSLLESTQVLEKNVDFNRFLWSSARSLLLQIIYAHRKSFDFDTFSSLKTILSSSEFLKKDEVSRVCSFLSLSKHHGLSSLVKPCIELVMEGLFLQQFSTEMDPSSLYTLGSVWSEIGRLRFHLLVGSGGELDPVMKYSVKYDQMAKKISSSELELEARRQSNDLVGWSYSERETFQQKQEDLRNLEIELRRLEKKVVHRAGVEKFTKLKQDCSQFLKMTESFIESTKKMTGPDLRRGTDQIRSWQETAASFICHLSEEYCSYVDIIQPVQVAVFEMKLGLSLVLSGSVQKGEEGNQVIKTVHSFVKFPRGCCYRNLHVDIIQNEESDHPFHKISLPETSLAGYLDLLDTSPVGENAAGEVVAEVRLKAAVTQSVLTRVSHSVCHSLSLDMSSFVLLDDVFERVVNMWMKAKFRAKRRSDVEAQQYRFRPRDFKIESVFGIDVSAFEGLLDGEIFTEWKELLLRENGGDVVREATTEADEEEEEWIVTEDSVSTGVVRTHTTLFGSVRTDAVSDADRLLLFRETYGSGMSMIRDMGPLCSSYFDDKMIQEHLLQVSLMHRDMILPVQKSYNFYRDANPRVMVGMVNPLVALRDHVGLLMNEWEEHVGVKKIMDVTEMLLSLPLSTPLAKVLSGLHFLLSRIWLFRESFPKSVLSDHAKPVLSLVASWHKIEFDSWESLVEDVHNRYFMNSESLWFPLYSILMCRRSSPEAEDFDVEGYDHSTVSSLEEFIHTSSIGEFRKRVDLLFSFHSQIEAGIHLGCYSTVRDFENLKIMYNVFGFYAQFVPSVTRHIERARENVEKEFKDVIKLSRWERFDSYLSVENVKRTQLKVKKLLQKYTDFLQQPVIVILDRELKNATTGGGDDFFAKSEAVLKAAFREDHSSYPLEENGAILNIPDSERPCEGGWEAMWDRLQGVCETAVHCCEIWQNREAKKMGKKRALNELLKELERSGLSGRRPALSAQWWFLGPSFSGRHLVHMGSCLESLSNIQGSNGSIDMEWVKSNQYYFSSIASLMLLQQSGNGFHKDFTLVQVEKSISLVGHMIAVQQEQRTAAYSFSKILKKLRDLVLSLGNLHSTASGISNPDAIDRWYVAPNQHLALKCMWQQKLVFDALCTLFHEEALLLKEFKNTHLNTCTGVREGLENAVKFINKITPAIKNGKELLDGYLLCSRGVVTMVEDKPLPPPLISERMEEAVHKNFETVKDLEEHYSLFCSHNIPIKLLFQESFGSSLENLVGMMKDSANLFYSRLQVKIHPLKNSIEEDSILRDSRYLKLKAGFDSALDGISKRAVSTLAKLRSSSIVPTGSDLSGKIVSWNTVFCSYSGKLELDVLLDELVRTVYHARELVDYSGSRVPGLCSEVGDQLKQLSYLLDLILNFSDGVLRDVMAINISISMITTAVGKMLAVLYSEGFGSPDEEEGEGVDQTKCQDGSKGTGMGEGVGLNDVSDQIEDEDQLLGASHTQQNKDESEEQQHQTPGKEDKGIEMDQDFEADTFSISGGESEDDGEESESENEHLESAMGETGDDSNIVGQKPSNQDDDDGNDNSKDGKPESGPTPMDMDPTDLELRGCESTEEEKASGVNPELLKEEEGGGDDDDNEGEIKEDFGKLDNSDNVSVGSLGAEDDRPDIGEEDEKLDISEEDEAMDEEETGPEEQAEKEAEGGSSVEEDARAGAGEEAKSGDGDGEGVETEQESGEKVTGMDPTGALSLETGYTGDGSMQVPPSGSAGRAKAEVVPVPGPGNPNSKTDTPDSDMREGTTVSMGGTHPDEDNLLGGSKTGAVTVDTRTRRPDPSILPETRANPYRNIGDALEEWKQRAKVSADLGCDDDGEGDDDGMDEDTHGEFGFTAGPGPEQTLGPATSEQVDHDLDRSGAAEEREPQGGEKAEPERPARLAARIKNLPVWNPGEAMSKAEEELTNLSQERENTGGEDSELGTSLVCFKNTEESAEIPPELEESAGDSVDLATEGDEGGGDVWREYEAATERATQELTEELRVVMEANRARRLEGEYRTGKRINMKKVIPYIASHYRRDKIWLRRRRADRREYQVVVAIDDSSSMAEARCGRVGTESLVAVCRAMGRLEVGELAVVSFGKRGSVRVLHGFDGGAVAGAAGGRVVSGLTFSQENTIEEGDPVVDLLRFLDGMLTGGAGAGCGRADGPSQLVLIIGDGRVAEVGRVRRGVRDVLRRRERMVAFVVMDSAETPVMEMAEASYFEGRIRMTKYMDSFPFPYYVVLRRVEELPAVLGALLKQWFQLIQLP